MPCSTCGWPCRCLASEAARQNDGAGARLALRLTALALGLGFLTKGPVALMFPMLVGGLYLLSIRQWRPIRDALLDFPAWLLLIATVLPWHVLVCLDQGGQHGQVVVLDQSLRERGE